MQKNDIKNSKVLKFSKTSPACYKEECVATEEPLEIQIAYGRGNQRTRKTIAVTMRTPGDDEALALGFLFNEGIIHRAAQVQFVKYLHQGSSLVVELSPDLSFDESQADRRFISNSSCGLCGKTYLHQVYATVGQVLPAYQPLVAPETLFQLPARLAQSQKTFQLTGGQHAVGLFDSKGNLIYLAEDVGRHNALDKLIGHCLKNNLLPLHTSVLLLSGRVSFELTQKALAAGIPFVAAIGAPSSLAAEMAEESGMTLVGFLRQDRFNVYCGAQRVGSD